MTNDTVIEHMALEIQKQICEFREVAAFKTLLLHDLDAGEEGRARVTRILLEHPEWVDIVAPLTPSPSRDELAVATLKAGMKLNYVPHE